MNIQEVITTINQMEADGVVDRYAIGALNAGRFQDIIVRHGLQDAWQRFEHQFLNDTP